MCCTFTGYFYCVSAQVLIQVCCSPAGPSGWPSFQCPESPPCVSAARCQWALRLLGWHLLTGNTCSSKKQAVRTALTCTLFMCALETPVRHLDCSWHLRLHLGRFGTCATWFPPGTCSSSHKYQKIQTFAHTCAKNTFSSAPVLLVWVLFNIMYCLILTFT